MPAENCTDADIDFCSVTKKNLTIVTNKPIYIIILNAATITVIKRDLLKTKVFRLAMATLYSREYYT